MSAAVPPTWSEDTLEHLHSHGVGGVIVEEPFSGWHPTAAANDFNDWGHVYPFGELITEFVLHIPAYQRPFSWDSKKGGQIDDLWSDVKRTACEKREDRRHFLGPMALHVQRDGCHTKLIGSGRKAFVHRVHVVDGQQRLTSVLIFVSSLLRALNSNQITSTLADSEASKEHKEAVDRLASTFFLQVWDKNYGTHGWPAKVRRIEVDQTLLDDDDDDNSAGMATHFFYKILFAPTSEAIDKLEEELSAPEYKAVALNPLRRMLKAAQAFDTKLFDQVLNLREDSKSQIPVEVSAMGSKASRLVLLSEVVLDNFRVCAYGSTEASLCSSAFDTLNNRGKPLNQLDVMKSFLFYKSTYLSDKDMMTKLQRDLRVVWQYLYVMESQYNLEQQQEHELLGYHYLLIFEAHAREDEGKAEAAMEEMRGGQRKKKSASPSNKWQDSEEGESFKPAETRTGTMLELLKNGNGPTNLITESSLFKCSDNEELGKALNYYLQTLWLAAHALLPLLARNKKGEAAPEPPLLVKSHDLQESRTLLAWPIELEIRVKELLVPCVLYKGKGYLESLLPFIGGLVICSDPTPAEAIVVLLSTFEAYFFRTKCAHLTVMEQRNVMTRGNSVAVRKTNWVYAAKDMCGVDVKTRELESHDLRECLGMVATRCNAHMTSVLGQHKLTGLDTSELYKQCVYDAQYKLWEDAEDQEDEFSLRYSLTGNRLANDPIAKEEGVKSYGWSQPLKVFLYMFETNLLMNELQVQEAKGNDLQPLLEQRERQRLAVLGQSDNKKHNLEFEHIIPRISHTSSGKGTLHAQWKDHLKDGIPSGEMGDQLIKPHEKKFRRACFELIEFELGNLMLIPAVRNSKVKASNFKEKVAFYKKSTPSKLRETNGEQTAAERDFCSKYGAGATAFQAQGVLDRSSNDLLPFMNDRYNNVQGPEVEALKAKLWPPKEKKTKKKGSGDEGPQKKKKKK